MFPIPYRHAFYFILFFLCVAQNVGFAQGCHCENCAQNIPDNGTVTFPITVGGAIKNDLATNNKVCKVCVRFKHDIVGDLTMKLISPSGQSVNLIGPISQVSLTDSSRWNICFLPQAQTAQPYPGFASTWSNAQNWGIFSNYTGSYYPYQGQLEDFNTGLVNGVWKLEVTDNDVGRLGRLLDWSIQFCDYSGIDCIDCEAYAGTLTSIAPISLCQGSPALNLQNIAPNFGWQGAPTPALYSYDWLITQNNIIQKVQKTPNLQAFAAGDYNVCGLSVLTTDTLKIPAPNGSLTATQLRNQLNSIAPPFCGKVTPTCFKVSIKASAIPKTLNQTICSGDSVKVGAITYKTQGVFIQSFMTTGGCDSTVTLNLTVNPKKDTTFIKSICQGKNIKIGTKTYTKTGVYTDVLKAKNGCDSTVRLTLIVNAAPQLVTTFTICKDDTLRIGKFKHFYAGNFSDTIKRPDGCDSIITFKLFINPKSQKNINATICSNECYSLGDSCYKNTGIYYAHLKNKFGCDSFITLHLKVKKFKTTLLNALICPNTCFKLKDTSFCKTGYYEVLYPSKTGGCDSLVKINLIVTVPIVKVIKAGLCPGDSIKIGSNTYHEPGNYIDTLTAVGGCDSIVFTNIKTGNPVINDAVTRICKGDVVLVGSHIYSQPGIYLDTLEAKAGCDSIVITDLIIKDPEKITLNKGICKGEKIKIGTKIYTLPGVYIDTLQTFLLGCDSIVTLNLVVGDIKSETINKTLCYGQTIKYGTKTYSLPGTYIDTLKIPNKCDSVFTLNLSILPKITKGLKATYCFGEKYTSGTIVHSTTGIFYDTLKTNLGCDSVVRLDLTIRPKAELKLSPQICSNEGYQIGNHIYTTTGIYRDTFQTAYKCDSIVILDLKVSDSLVTNLNPTVCAGKKYTYNNVQYGFGNYTFKLKSIFGGCDSIIHLKVDTLPMLGQFVVAKICKGESYKVGNKTFTLAGDYEETVQNKLGCDSIIYLTLIVNAKSDTSFSKTICAGQNVKIGKVIHSTTGIFVDTLINKNKCDSIVTLNLKIKAKIQKNIDTTLCFSKTYAIGIHTYTQSGMYKDTLIAQDGCDSIITLKLTIRPKNEVTVSRTECEGKSQFPTSGTYPSNYIDQYGCDSTFILKLTVVKRYELFLKDTLCEGKTRTIGASVYAVSGNYTDSLKTKNGCDSIVHLALFVAPCSANFSITAHDVRCHNQTSGRIILMANGIAQSNFSYECINLSAGNNTIKGNVKGGETDTIQNLNFGKYKVLIYNSLGVKIKDTTLTISNPNALEIKGVISTFGKYNVSCADATDGRIKIKITQNTAPPYRFLWDNDAETDTLPNLGVGTYKVTVTDANGCSTSDNFTLTAPTPIAFAVQSKDISCFGKKDGKINIQATNGGTKPYLYSFDNQSFVSSTMVSNLSAGVHKVIVQDANGCEKDTMITLLQPDSLTLFIGNDTLLDIGDSLYLRVLTNLPTNRIDTLLWSSNLNFCPNCLEIPLRPLQSTIYQLKLISDTGCEIKDEIKVNVKDKLPVYAPTAFSPNGDNNNDRFMLYSNESVLKINVLRVFDRWGNLVYEGFNLPTNDLSVGWDGTYRGATFNSSVFIYTAEILFKDGRVAILKGEVLLLR